MAVACLLGVAIAGCSSSREFMDDRGYLPLWQGERFGWVRLVNAEPEAEVLAHPASISESGLRERLSGLRLIAGGTVDGVPLIGEAGAEDVAGPIARGLGQADPEQEVVFAVTGRYGRLGVVSEPTATTGRVFVRDDRLELIIGQARAEFLGRLRIAGVEPEFVPGQRAQRVERGWRLDCAAAGGIQRRADWCSFPIGDAGATPAPSAPAATGDAPAVTPDAATPESSSPTAVERLRTLKRLLDEGLITPEDYEAKKQEILDAL
jgi:hypothetical protein